MSRLARKYKKHKRSSSAPRPNPPFWADMGNQVLPAVAGFAGSRLLTRMLTLMLAKRWPKLARHAGAIAGVGVFAGAYWGAHKIKALARWADGIVVGAGVGAAATVVQTYIPKLGWIMKEVDDAEIAPPAPAAEQVAAGEFDEDWGAYNDAFDSGRYQQQRHEVKQSPNVDASTRNIGPSAQTSLEELVSEMESKSGWNTNSLGGN